MDPQQTPQQPQPNTESNNEPLMQAAVQGASSVLGAPQQVQTVLPTSSPDTQTQTTQAAADVLQPVTPTAPVVLPPSHHTPSQSTPAGPAVVAGGGFDDPSGKAKSVTLAGGDAPKGKLALIKKYKYFVAGGVLAGIILMFGAFYFLYWTSKDVVYRRFQNKIASFIDSSTTTNLDLINDFKFDVSLSSNGGDIDVAASSKGRGVESGTEASTNIDYLGATLNVDFKLLNDKDNPYVFYVKAKGIKTMVNKVLEQNGSSSPFNEATLDELEDQWYFLDYGSLLSESADDSQEPLTKEQYKELWQVSLPIIKERLVGLGDVNDVYKTSNPRSEKVAGKSTWAFDVTYDKQAFNDMVDELIKAVDSTSFDITQKRLVKDAMESAKEFIPKEEANSQNSVYNRGNTYREEQRYTIWIEKNSGMPLKYEAYNEYFYGNESSSKTVTVLEVKKISGGGAEGTISSETTSKYSTSNETATFVLDNKSKTLTVDGKLDRSTPDAKETESSLTFKVKVEPNDSEEEVQAPDGAQDIMQVLERLYGTGF